MPETHEAAQRRSFAAEHARIGCAWAEDLNVLRVTKRCCHGRFRIAIMRQPRAKCNALVRIQNNISDSCDHSDDYI